MLEVKAIVNSHPLTDVVVEPGSELPLNPNHLLQLNSDVRLPIVVSEDKDVYARKRYRVVQYVADQFWRRSIVEYPRTLFTRKKWQERCENLKCAGIVFISDASAARGDWPLGVIVNIYPDEHCVVRVVDVKSKSGILRRPVTKLCVMTQSDQ